MVRSACGFGLPASECFLRPPFVWTWSRRHMTRRPSVRESRTPTMARCVGRCVLSVAAIRLDLSWLSVTVGSGRCVSHDYLESQGDLMASLADWEAKLPCSRGLRTNVMGNRAGWKLFLAASLLGVDSLNLELGDYWIAVYRYLKHRYWNDVVEDGAPFEWPSRRAGRYR